MGNKPRPNQTPAQAAHAAYMRQYLRDHPEKAAAARARSRAYREAHPDRQRDAWKKSHEANPEKERAAKRAYSEREKTDPELRRKRNDRVLRWIKRNPEYNRERSRLRKLLKRGVEVDRGITLRRVGERDGWTCGLCRQAVDRTLIWPERMSATIDHVLPLSLGGSHTWANVQLAHFACNSEKGATPAQ